MIEEYEYQIIEDIDYAVFYNILEHVNDIIFLDEIYLIGKNNY